MKINQFSQQGKRSNNEDSVGYSKGLLTVCDGIGGHVSGERASAFVIEAMLKAFAAPQPIGKMEIQQQLNKVQTDLNQLLEKEPELEKMGTTFTGIFLTPDVWYAAHIGDSRIYLFRPSEQKLWHTWDHSLVGELMRTHEITVEAGRFHPMSNRIAKAIIAQKDGNPSNASIVKIDELKAGDIFMLCSDGVVEAWGDLELVKLFSDTSLSFEQKCKQLKKQCAEKSKDNNTALIAEIEEKDAFSFGGNDELEWTTFAEVEADYQQYLKDTSESDTENTTPHEPLKEDPQPIEEKPRAKAPERPLENKLPDHQYATTTVHRRRRWWPLLVVALAIVGLVLFFLLRGGKAEVKEEKQGSKAKEETVDRRVSKNKIKVEEQVKKNPKTVDEHVSPGKAVVNEEVRKAPQTIEIEQQDDNKESNDKKEGNE